MTLAGRPGSQITTGVRAGSGLAPYGTAVAVAATGLYVGLVDPSTSGWFPSCPTRELTGAWCPMCGMTRAVHHLLHGDIVTALRFNLFVVPVLLVIAVSLVARVRRAGGRTAPRSRGLATAWFVAAAMLMVYAAIRNVPALGVLRGVAS